MSSTSAVDASVVDAKDVQPSEPQAATPPSEDSLRTRVTKSSFWVAVEFFGTQGVRFGGNLVLTRLLFEEAFGIMMLVTTFLMGLQMFSDIGIGPSIVQHKRGDDPDYLNTAWTIQAVRGAVLWLAALVLSYPVALMYDEPSLALYLPVAAITALTMGLQSTNVFWMNRHLTLGPIVLLKVSVAVTSISITILLAWLFESVWALVLGSVVASVLFLVASHTFLPGIRNRFHWDWGAAKELFRFGRWLFLSTVLTFLAMRVDQILIPKLVGFAFFGVFAIGYSISQVPQLLMSQVAGSIGFPALSTIYRRDRTEFGQRLMQMRLLLVGPMSAIFLGLALLGPPLVRLLYPEEFHPAGWMVRVLCVGGLAITVTRTYADAFMAMGDSFRVMLSVGIQTVITVLAVFIGHDLGAEEGVIYALGAVPWLLYPFQTVLAATAGIWQPRVDLPVLAVLGGAGYWVLLG